MDAHLSEFGLIDVGVCAPELRVADVEFNTERITAAILAAAGDGAEWLLLPELAVTGYTAADLFYQSRMLDDVEASLAEIVATTAECNVGITVGLPWRIDGRLFNCAAVAHRGRLLGMVPKTFLPSTGEYYEERWFASGQQPIGPTSFDWHGLDVPFGTDLLFRALDLPGLVVAVEICEDLWSPQPPSGDAAIAGATLLLNPSASVELIGKADYRRDLVRQQSARCNAAYVYAASGPGESTTDVVFSGHCLIYEDGHYLAETDRFRFGTEIAIATIDVDRLIHDRLQNSTFSRARSRCEYRTVEFSLHGEDVDEAASDAPRQSLRRPNPKQPFVPANPATNAAHCEEIFRIQATALAKRFRHTGIPRAVIGVSGGLDSTLALLVLVHAFDLLERPRQDVLGITMPGFGTTEGTKSNAVDLSEHLGIELSTIPIEAAVRQHFADIGHDPSNHDVTFENAQARERTQILMDVANARGGLVVGTGDLSELALGWCTFNADHMSMYHVNAGVPKTLVRHLVRWCADEVFTGDVARVLHAVCETPISPELLPHDEGEIAQKTEDTIGPYVLHDYFLFHVVRHGCSPRKVFWLAERVFADEYDSPTILKWLRVFYRRFFAQQFKRSAMPDGPKVGTVALSPRGDWRMPSDASAATWLAELDEIEGELSDESS